MTDRCPWCASSTLSNLERHYFECYSFVADGFKRQSLKCKLTCAEIELKLAKDLLRTVLAIHDGQSQHHKGGMVQIWLPDPWRSAARVLLQEQQHDGTMPMRQDAQPPL